MAFKAFTLILFLSNYSNCVMFCYQHNCRLQWLPGSQTNSRIMANTVVNSTQDHLIKRLNKLLKAKVSLFILMSVISVNTSVHKVSKQTRPFKFRRNFLNNWLWNCISILLIDIGKSHCGLVCCISAYSTKKLGFAFQVSH